MTDVWVARVSVFEFEFMRGGDEVNIAVFSALSSAVDWVRGIFQANGLVPAVDSMHLEGEVLENDGAIVAAVPDDDDETDWEFRWRWAINRTAVRD